ncbi:hypothetical protein [Tenacibaculum sp. 190524A05c]|uniref:Uncharacterized protein n=1 Tax=Tenacibaculum platacis TaxID=3137852 RepID=A0ABP1ENJ1_9FLAO
MKIEIASVPDREYLVAEIWDDNILIAEVNQEKLDLTIEFYFNKDKIKLEYDYELFIETLIRAKELLKQ